MVCIFLVQLFKICEIVFIKKNLNVKLFKSNLFFNKVFKVMHFGPKIFFVDQSPLNGQYDKQ